MKLGDLVKIIGELSEEANKNHDRGLAGTNRRCFTFRSRGSFMTQ